MVKPISAQSSLAADIDSPNQNETRVPLPPTPEVKKPRGISLLLLQYHQSSIRFWSLALLDILHLSVLAAHPEISRLNSNIFYGILGALFVIFVLEFVVSCFAMGIKGYLKTPFAWLDVMTIPCFWVSLLLFYSLPPDRRVQGQYFQVFSTLAAFRPLRLLGATSGTRRILMALRNNASQIASVFGLLFYFFLLFAIFGNRAFSGSFRRRCFENNTVSTFLDNSSFVFDPLQDPVEYTVFNSQSSNFTAYPLKYCGSFQDADDQTQPALPFVPEFPISKAKGYSCPTSQMCITGVSDPDFSGFRTFDDILSAFLNVFVTVSTEGWTLDMYRVQDSENQVYVPFYYLLAMIVLNYLMLNLFVAVIFEAISETFNAQDNLKAYLIQSDLPLLNDDGKGWVFVATKQTFFFGWPQEKAQALVTNKWWRHVMTLIVFLDVVAQATKTANSTPSFLAILDWIELGFTVFFALEMLLMLFALGPRYFSSHVNKADFFLVIVTCVIQIPQIKQWEGYGYLTFFQLARFYRVVNGIPLIKELVKNAFMSVLDLLNVTIFTVITMLVLAGVYIQLIGTQYYEQMDQYLASNQTVVPPNLPYLTFATYFDSFVGVFTIWVSDGWDIILYQLMGVQLDNFEPTHPFYSYFVVGLTSLIVCITYIFFEYILRNMVIAAVLGNFEKNEDEKIETQYLQYLKEVEKTRSLSTMTQKISATFQKFLQSKGATISVPSVEDVFVARINKSLYKSIMKDMDDEEEEEDDGIGPRSNTMNMGTMKPLKGAEVSDLTEEKKPNENQGAAEDIFERTSLFKYPMVQKSLGEGTANVVEGFIQGTALLSEDKEKKKETSLFFTTKDDFNLVFGFLDGNHWLRRTAVTITEYSLFKKDDEAKNSAYTSYKERPLSQQLRSTKPLFDWFIILVIFLSTGFLAAETPIDRLKQSPIIAVYRILDYIFIVCFAIEAILRILANGVILTKKAYFKNPWNVIDFIILCCMCIDTFYFQPRVEASQGVGRFFRAIRAIRPIRLINQFDGLKNLLQVAAKGWKQLLQALLLTILVFFPYSVWGLNLWAGKFYSCNDPAVFGRADCYGDFMLQLDTGEEGANLAVWVPRVWSNPFYYNFDTVYYSFFTLFKMSSEEAWLDVFTTARNFKGYNVNPGRQTNDAAIIYFFPYMVLAFLVVNLFTAVVVDSFEQNTGASIMTLDQRKWQDLNRQLSLLRPSKLPPCPSKTEHPIRFKIYNLVLDKKGKFAKAMTTILILNLIIMCTAFYLEPVAAPSFFWVREGIIILFILTYVAELLLKMVALGFLGFWKSRWNWYDVAVVLGALVTAVAVVFTSAFGSENYSLQQAEKVFQLLIIFRLVQKLDQLEILFKTILSSAIHAYNITIMVLLLMVIFSIMCVQLFALTRFRGETNENVSFRSFPRAMLVLFRMTTGENWHYIMGDIAIEFPYCVPSDDALQTDCGSPSWSYFLIIVFYILLTWLVLDLFVGVIMDRFSFWYEKDVGTVRLKREDLRKFKSAWRYCDGTSTGFIEPAQLPTFLFKLGGKFDVKPYGEVRIIQDPKDQAYLDFKTQALSYYKRSVKNPKDNSSDAVTSKLIPYLTSQNVQFFEKTSIKEIRKKRQELNEIFLEALMAVDKAQKIAFMTMLNNIFSYRLMSTGGLYLSLNEANARRLLKEKQISYIALERVAGFVYNYKLKKTLELRGKSYLLAASFRKDRGTEGKLSLLQQLPPPEEALISEPKQAFKRMKTINKKGFVRKAERRKTAEMGTEDLDDPTIQTITVETTNIDDAVESMKDEGSWVKDSIALMEKRK